MLQVVYTTSAFTPKVSGERAAGEVTAGTSQWLGGGGGGPLRTPGLSSGWDQGRQGHTHMAGGTRGPSKRTWILR